MKVETFPYIDTDKTIKLMQDTASGPDGEQSVYLRELIEHIIRFVRPKDKASCIAAVYRWFLEHYTYVYDPELVERIKTPARAAKEIVNFGKLTGDCDDAATFLVAAMRSIGIDACFARVGFNPEIPADNPHAYSHVFAIAKDQHGRIVVLDPVAGHNTLKMIAQGRAFKF